MKNIVNKVIDALEEGLAVIEFIGMPRSLYKELTGKHLAGFDEYRGYDVGRDENMFFGVHTITGLYVTMVYDTESGEFRVMVEKKRNDPSPMLLLVSLNDMPSFIISLNTRTCNRISACMVCKV